MTDKKLTPDVLLAVTPDKMRQLQKTAKATFMDVHRRIKHSDGTYDATWMELVIVDLWLRLIHNCHQAVQVNQLEQPQLTAMIDRMQVLGNQMEEIYIHGRELDIPETQADHGNNVVLFDPENAPTEVQQAAHDAGLIPEGGGLRLQPVADQPGSGLSGEDQPVQHS